MFWSAILLSHYILLAVVFKASLANMSFNFTQILQISNNSWFVWLICHLQLGHILDTNKAYLSFTVLSQIGHFWLFCHLQFCHILDTFGLSVIYSLAIYWTLLAYLSFTGLSQIGHFWFICHCSFSQIRCIGLTYHLQVLPQTGHICTLFI